MEAGICARIAPWVEEQGFPGILEAVKILLDTDPGSDIDDAIALAYLARHPDCELLGVTTVTGDVRRRAAIVEVVLRAFGREDVPIVAGASDVLAAYRHFAMLPALHAADGDDERLCLWFEDLRFALVGREMPFRYGACRTGGHWRVYRYGDQPILPRG